MLPVLAAPEAVGAKNAGGITPAITAEVARLSGLEDLATKLWRVLKLCELGEHLLVVLAVTYELLEWLQQQTVHVRLDHVL